MYTATLAGLRWKGIGHLGVVRVRPGGFEHAWQVARTAVQFGRAMPDWDVMSERQLRDRPRANSANSSLQYKSARQQQARNDDEIESSTGEA
jgi:hypothetical protein